MRRITLRTGGGTNLTGGDLIDGQRRANWSRRGNNL